MLPPARPQECPPVNEANAAPRPAHRPQGLPPKGRQAGRRPAPCSPPGGDHPGSS
ncbi:hypothetical protein PtB15_4B276 [Puccinia triticina]|nr:hypothetical protein PtB15_4B276 [Puccinia triticina]